MPTKESAEEQPRKHNRTFAYLTRGRNPCPWVYQQRQLIACNGGWLTNGDEAAEPTATRA